MFHRLTLANQEKNTTTQISLSLQDVPVGTNEVNITPKLSRALVQRHCWSGFGAFFGDSENF